MHKLFPSQRPGEKIYIVTRESLFILFLKFFIVFLFSLLPIIFYYLLQNSELFLATKEFDLYYSLISKIYYTIIAIAFFIIFVLHYLNVHIVSEQRIVDIDQRGLLFREVSELNIETIEDVTSQTKGLLGNLFNFGTVFVQTAGTVERFEFDNVPNPSRITSIILQLYEQHSSKEEPKV
jgi:hypothetical protein